MDFFYATFTILPLKKSWRRKTMRKTPPTNPTITSTIHSIRVSSKKNYFDVKSIAAHKKKVLIPFVSRGFSWNINPYTAWKTTTLNTQTTYSFHFLYNVFLLIVTRCVFPTKKLSDRKKTHSEFSFLHRKL